MRRLFLIFVLVFVLVLVFALHSEIDMYTQTDAEAFVVEVIVFGWPAVDEGIAGIYAELELFPSEAQHQLGFHQEMGVGVALVDSPGSIVANIDFVPMWSHNAAFQTNSDVEIALGQFSPSEVDLAIHKIVITVDKVFVGLRFTLVVEI